MIFSANHMTCIWIFLCRTMFRWVHKPNLFNPFPNKPWFLSASGRSLLKTLWEKEKLLVTSNFSFSHRVFYLFGKLPFSSNLILLPANCFSLEESKICCLGKGLTFYYFTVIHMATLRKGVFENI